MVNTFYADNGKKIASNLFLDSKNKIRTYWFFDLDDPDFDRFLCLADLVRQFYSLPAYRIRSMTPGNFHLLVPAPTYHIYCLLCSNDRRGYYRFKHIKFLRWTQGFQEFLEKTHLTPLVYKQVNAEGTREIVYLNNAPIPSFRATIEYMVRANVEVNPLVNTDDSKNWQHFPMLPTLELARTIFKATLEKKRWKLSIAEKAAWKPLRRAFMRDYIQKFNLTLTEEELAKTLEYQPKSNSLKEIPEKTPFLVNSK